jgi:2-methylisocitrate lyase-like PEP mutase family enzyme
VEVGAEDLRLTIERGSDPIAGSLGLPDGRALRFEGYVQLVAALEDVRNPPPSDDPEEGGTA